MTPEPNAPLGHFAPENEAVPRLGRVGDVLTWAVIGLVAFWAAWPTIGRGFIGDDFAYVARFAGLEAAELPALFVNDWSGGMWGANTYELRPVAALTFWLDAKLCVCGGGDRAHGISHHQSATLRACVRRSRVDRATDRHPLALGWPRSGPRLRPLPCPR
jgi:hypothetical protein